MSTLAAELRSLEPEVASSPVSGFEHVRGFGVFAHPFDSGHVLALRVFPRNDFAPYRTIWHRTPEGDWTIYVDGPRIETACPRYYGAAARRSAFARITLTWTGPNDLAIEMDAPALRWDVSMMTTPGLRIMNAVSASLPERLWRAPFMLRLFERIGSRFLGMGDVTLSGRAPNGQFGILMPRRMYLVEKGEAVLDGENLGRPVRLEANPTIGALRLPARPVFAIGGAYFDTTDDGERARDDLLLSGTGTS